MDKSGLSSLELAELIVDALIDGGVVAKDVFEQATRIAAAELASAANHLTTSALASSVVQALVRAQLVPPASVDKGCAITVEELDVRRALDSSRP